MPKPITSARAWLGHVRSFMPTRLQVAWALPRLMRVLACLLVWHAGLSGAGAAQEDDEATPRLVPFFPLAHPSYTHVAGPAPNLGKVERDIRKACGDAAVTRSLARALREVRADARRAERLQRRTDHDKALDRLARSAPPAEEISQAECRNAVIGAMLAVHDYYLDDEIVMGSVRAAEHYRQRAGWRILAMVRGVSPDIGRDAALVEEDLGRAVAALAGETESARQEGYRVALAGLSRALAVSTEPQATTLLANLGVRMAQDGMQRIAPAREQLPALLHGFLLARLAPFAPGSAVWHNQLVDGMHVASLYPHSWPFLLNAFGELGEFDAGRALLSGELQHHTFTAQACQKYLRAPHVDAGVGAFRDHEAGWLEQVVYPQCD